MWNQDDGLDDGILGRGRRPGPIGAEEASVFPWPSGAVRVAPPLPSIGLDPGDDMVRQRFLAIRARMRALMAAEDLPVDGVILYSGTREFLNDFRSHLEKQGCAPTVYLEMTQAGIYLEQMTHEVLKHDLLSHPDADWNKRVAFSGAQGSFTVSLMGFWRELSARFAKKASGCVHVLLSRGRLELPQAGQMFWEQRLRSGATEGLSAETFLAELKTFGFAELPVLLGQISSNTAVQSIKVYEPLGGSSFRLDRTIPVAHRDA